MSRLLGIGSEVLRNLSPSRVIERLSFWRPSPQARATFSSELAAKIFPLQISGVFSLIPVCLVVKLPADWLNDPLISVLCLLAFASFLSLYSLLHPSGRNHTTLIISIVLTMAALGILVGACVANLISLQLATTQARKGDVGEPSTMGIDKTTAPMTSMMPRKGRKFMQQY